MRQKLALAVTGTAALFALTACGGDDPTANTAEPDPENPVVVTVGASPVPHAQILEYVDENLAQEAGIDLEIEEFDDYKLVNPALDEGSIDANYFQHLPYFEDQVSTAGYEFGHGAGVHIEPYAAFSSKYEDVSDIPDGATVAITSDQTNQLRSLKMLEDAGLLKDVDDESLALLLTDAQNPKGLKFEENQPEVIVQQIEDPAIDLAFVNGNYFLAAGLDVNNALLVESVTEENPYANFLTWRDGEDTPAIQKLDELLHSDEVKSYIEETWNDGSVLPVG